MLYEIMPFLIIGIIFTGIVFFLQINLGLIYKIILIFVLLILLIISSFLLKEPTRLNGENWYNESPYFELILFFVMISGMFARYFHSAIEERNVIIQKLKKEKGNNKFKKPKLEFDVWDFTSPLFVSVITFGVILGQIENNYLSYSNILLGFETGFIWQTIIKKK